ncbi:glycosyltransferase [Microbacterium cremeum]|uniref:glycosyltransferase n=1 Tax=Microbacterium cremeum TaxID=2782169 RepID=UPI001887076E|nr:glycosyltransferase [Microbacterium cremeum]
MTVSVVIPTTGRPELSRAVRSARDQRGEVEVEVVVVNDSPDDSATAGVDADVVVWTGGRRGGGHARNRGVEAAGGRYVAFLDDDDEWTPTKLDHQLQVVEAAPRPHRTVVSGRHVHVAPGAVEGSEPGPTTLIAPSESVGEYLFRRRRPSIGRSAMYTSTLLCHQDLARAVRWREDLRRHQDWDWLIRLGKEDGVAFVHCPSVVARIQTGTSNSISAGSDWQSSLAWADETLDDDAVYVDFVVGQTLRYALTARSRRGVSAVLGRVAQRRRVPSLGPSVLGLAGIVPRRRLESLMTRDVTSASGA